MYVGFISVIVSAVCVCVCVCVYCKVCSERNTNFTSKRIRHDLCSLRMCAQSVTEMSIRNTPLGVGWGVKAAGA
jgi:hypothetical protein